PREEQLRDRRRVRFDRHGELRSDRARRAGSELPTEDAPVADPGPEPVALARGQGSQAPQDDRAALRVEIEGNRAVRPAAPRERERAHDVRLLQHPRELALEAELAADAVSVEPEAERDDRGGGGREPAPDHAAGRARGPPRGRLAGAPRDRARAKGGGRPG